MNGLRPQPAPAPVTWPCASSAAHGQAAIKLTDAIAVCANCANRVRDHIQARKGIDAWLALIGRVE